MARGPGIVVGILFAAEFLLLAEGLRWTSAAHMVVFLYTAPLFAALGLHLRLPDERLTRHQWGGMALAFAGIVVSFVGSSSAEVSSSHGRQLLGDMLGVGAGAAYGLTTVAVRTSRLSEAPASQTLFYQLAGAFMLLLPLAFITGAARFLGTPLAWASVGFQAIIVSFASYLAWFWLLRRYRAAELGVLSFMTPLFGAAMGALLLREPLEASFVLGAALVVAGLIVVNLRSVLKARRATVGLGAPPR
jgi:drug/metabolite transporter (DMT)-like permease